MSHYVWKWGDSPPPIKRHSQVKHALLRNYLIEYFLTLVSMPHQDRIRLTIVDGFCGGGLYLNKAGHEVPGSPLVILEAIREATYLIETRQERRKPIDLDVELICVDKERSALKHLEQLLKERGHGAALAAERIKLVLGDFADHCAATIKQAHDRSRKSGRAIFVLDQYGYSRVPVQCLREIFARLNHAEVILTFYIDALISYLNAGNLASFEQATGIRGGMTAAEIDDMKKSPTWRVHLQSSLYQSLTSQCSAQFYTPFFIRPQRGHGDFWLLHLSQHWKARDVMASTHWQHSNHFSHYGRAGFHMFSSTGYITKIDSTDKLQSGFDFSEVAASMSHETMLEQIPSMLFDAAEGMSFEQFFLQRINTTPATREMVESALLTLSQRHEIEILGADGEESRAKVHLKPEHVLRLPRQTKFFF